MGTTINYASTPKVGSATLAGFDASFTAPSTTSTIVTAGTSGSKIEEVVVQGLATLVAAVLNLWVHDGTNYSLIDQFLLTVSPTASTTAVAYRAVRQYSNLWLPAPTPTWTLRASHTVTGNDTSKLRVTAFYADL